jgi:hypothetical protein
LMWVAVHALVLVGLVGLRRVLVSGESPWARRGLDLAIAGRVVFLVAEVASIAVGHDELPVFPVAVISTGVGMLVAGVGVLRPGGWRGWRGGLALVAMGVYPFVLILPVFAITGERPNNLVVASWGLTYLAIAAAAARVPSDRHGSLPGRASLVGSSS